MKKAAKKPTGKTEKKEKTRALDSALACALPSKPSRPATRPGAPRLPSTLWLEEQMEQLPAGVSPYRLYRGWLACYLRTMGREPADPEGSFRAAIRSVRKRLKTKGQEGRGF